MRKWSVGGFTDSSVCGVAEEAEHVQVQWAEEAAVVAGRLVTLSKLINKLRLVGARFLTVKRSDLQTWKG